MTEEGSTEKLEFQYVNIPNLTDSNLSLCQCCLSTKDLRSIVKPYLYCGANEIYSDMLTRCFSKELSADEGWICSDCVGRLRATVSFRDCVESAKNYLNSQLENETITDNGKYFERHKIYVVSDDDDYVDEYRDGDDRPHVIKGDKAPTHGLPAMKPAVAERPSAVAWPPAPKASSKLPLGTDSSSDEDFFEEYFKPIPTSPTVLNRAEFDVSESSTLPYILDGTERTCKICQKEFSFFRHLLNHMPEHYPNHICDICGRIFATRKSFELHLQVHTDKRYQCQKCEKSFKYKHNLSKHFKVAHKGIKPLFNCIECGETLTTYYKRLLHMAEKHGREAKSYKCQQCPVKYTLASHLSSHIRRFHLQERKHVCQECSSSFFTKNCLEQHSAKHTGVRKYACHICIKTYKTNYGLSLHKKKTHGGNGQTAEQ